MRRLRVFPVGSVLPLLIVLEEQSLIAEHTRDKVSVKNDVSDVFSLSSWLVHCPHIEDRLPRRANFLQPLGPLKPISFRIFVALEGAIELKLPWDSYFLLLQFVSIAVVYARSANGCNVGPFRLL